MSPAPNRPAKEPKAFSPILLLPNMLTVTAICAGLTAIRAGVHGNYELAVQLIIVAGILDGLDGRLARALGSASKIGAELDSLADFVNFGVATPLTLYFWALQDSGGIGWIAVLVFSICCVFRLARFNVGSKTGGGLGGAYFEGVPSPAGALVVMLPLYVSFAFADRPSIPALLISLHMIVIGLLMISSLPTWSFKTTRIARGNVKFFLVGVAAVGALLVTYAWRTLIVLCLAYIVTVLWAWLNRRRLSRR
ncbi:CDP-alcohol phosphatidyltransferase family protein [Mangrovicoccus algicola]|uniref:Phosphatidylcholine/phosphatidylserine synthase n=1 Tax=Mangrovicoccus algicola TaxID=2771008 RepID=A0A8J7CIB5_9RHOB|nr:phosphatidylcholine/phosphatidylserine synthase [Mangrovicoccus algicola]MBE3639375.1 phosphatidylcholine/phosphatidylserine synthase [Mangrovicoccus algicola]